MSTVAADRPGVEPRPLALLAAGVIAIAALHLTNGGWVLPLLGVAFALAWAVPARLEPGSSLGLALGLGLGALAWFSTPSAGNDGVDAFITAQVTRALGQTGVAVLVMQAWQRDPKHHGLPLLLMSSLVLVAAGNTFEGPHLRIVSPLYVLCAVLTLLRYTRRQASREGTPVRTEVVRWAAVCAALGLGAGAHYGLLAYRHELTTWTNNLLLPENLTAPVTGMSAAPELGSSFDMQQSPVRVLRAEGMEGITHLRGAAFDTYDVGRWGPPLRSQAFESAGDALRPEAPGRRALVTRFTEDFRLVFAPLNAAGLNIPDEAATWAPSRGGAIRAGTRWGALQYEVVLGERETDQGPLAITPDADQRRRLLQVPGEMDEQVRELAARIGHGRTGPLEMADAVQEYLLSHHRYSLTFRRGEGDPVTSFLLEGTAAHCQYFASAAVILLRLLHVPARYVNGYYAHESGGPGVTIVRQRDAHAWAEAWIEGTGWVTVDATPGDGRPDRLSDQLPFWIRPWEAVQDGLTALMGRISRLTPTELALVLFGLGGIWIAQLAWRQRKEARPQGKWTGYSSPGAELERIGRQFEVLLRLQGAPCPPGRPWSEHLRGEAASGLANVEDLREFADAYSRMRFRGDAPPDELSGLGRRLRELESAGSRVRGSGLRVQQG